MDTREIAELRKALDFEKGITKLIKTQQPMVIGSFIKSVEKQKAIRLKLKMALQRGRALTETAPIDYEDTTL